MTAYHLTWTTGAFGAVLAKAGENSNGFARNGQAKAAAEATSSVWCGHIDEG